jgi:hypothetical protein
MTIRQAAKSLLLHANVPRRYWEHAISHAVYLNNITSKSRAEPAKTSYELLFGTKVDITLIPPFGCFASIYKERRQLKDQSLDLTSTPGVFIGISRHNKVPYSHRRHSRHRHTRQARLRSSALSIRDFEDQGTSLANFPQTHDTRCDL